MWQGWARTPGISDSTNVAMSIGAFIVSERARRYSGRGAGQLAIKTFPAG
jgi:hypothetical protein